MVLTATQCAQQIRHTLGGELSSELDPLRITNEVGRMFVTMHAWKWLETAEANLDLRGSISITGGSWDLADHGEGDLHLTKASAFDDYTFSDGDTFEVTGGTDAILGHYRVTKRMADGNAILLESAITSSGEPSDIAGTLHTSAIALPSDFRELIAINTTSGLLRGVALTDHAELIQRRAASFVSEGFHYGAIVHAQSSATAGGAPTPRIEIWPAPSANELGVLTIMYRAGWKSISNDTDLISIPDWIEPLYIQILRAFARGYEEEDAQILDQRLVAATNGIMFFAAVDRDAMVQPHYGKLRGGGATRTGFESFGNFNAVSAPS